MVHRDGPDDKAKVLDYIYELLKKNKQPIHYSVLMDEVADHFYSQEEDLVKIKARFYTWLNLDTRFTNMGQGCWGLRNWSSQKKAGNIPVLTLMHKSVEYDDALSESSSDLGGDEEEEAEAEAEVEDNDLPDDEDKDDFEE